MTKPTKRKRKKQAPIKHRILEYMEFHDLSYTAMAELLGEDVSRQSLHRWLSSEKESFASLVERKFNDLV